MSFLNHIHVPQEWVYRQKAMLQKKRDEKLISMDKLVDLVTECGLCDDASIRKVDKNINTLQFMWSIVDTCPSDAWSTKIFTNCLHFLCGVFVIDDTVEHYTTVEMEKLCNAFDLLEHDSCKSFPNFPSIADMKSSLKRQLTNKFDIASVTFCMQYVNKMASIILMQGNIPQNVVFNFRRRTSNAISMSLQATLMKSKSRSPVTSDQMLWRRIFDGLAILFYQFGELMSGGTKLVQDNIAVVTELRMLGSVYCIVINDLYSYHRDKLTTSDSVIKTWLNEKTVSSESEATTKCCQILDAVMQYMYQRITEYKLRSPDCPELEVLLEGIAYTTVGWIFSHTKIVPRYTESPATVELVEVAESELVEWMTEKNENGWKVVEQFVQTMNDKKNKGILDAVAGYVEGRGQLVKSLMSD